ncbi:MAG: hypothetical protein QXG35_05250 [Nitrososphaerota archaeon]
MPVQGFYVRTADQMAVAECCKFACEEFSIEIDGELAARPAFIEFNPKVDEAIYVKTKAELKDGRTEMIRVFQVVSVSEKGFFKKGYGYADLDDVCRADIFYNEVERTVDLDVVGLAEALYEHLICRFGWDNVKIFCRMAYLDIVYSAV